ncbi:hypothetical protein [Egicoccus sp. AB-alg6-2]
MRQDRAPEPTGRAAARGIGVLALMALSALAAACLIALVMLALVG